MDIPTDQVRRQTRIVQSLRSRVSAEREMGSSKNWYNFWHLWDSASVDVSLHNQSECSLLKGTLGEAQKSAIAELYPTFDEH